MRPARALVVIASAVALFACTSGQTQVQGLPESSETGGPTGPTAPTGATAPAGAFSLEFPALPPQVSDAAFFTCEGLEGVWHYIFQANFGQGIDFNVDTTVDMEGGDGTLVFGGSSTSRAASSRSRTPSSWPSPGPRTPPPSSPPASTSA